MIYTIKWKFLLAFLFVGILYGTVVVSQAHGAVDILCQKGNSTLTANDFPACTSIAVGELGFKIPTLGDILTFVIRAFFVIAGLAALFYMLLGAFAWVTSAGEAEAVGAAQQKIQGAVIGMIVIVAVLAVIWTMEQVIFNRKICLGLSCPLTLPGLIEPKKGVGYCCSCVNQDTGTLGDVIDATIMECLPNGAYDPNSASTQELLDRF